MSVSMGNVWPDTAERAPSGELLLGGVGVNTLAERYGTPLYVYDERTLRGRARLMRESFAAAYPRSRVVYAGKAFLNVALLRILREEGLGLDVASGGELHVGLAAGVPPGEIVFHGNNKSERELAEAIAAGVGAVVVDNEHEIALLARLTAGRASPLTVLLRLNPGVDVHTHAKIRTGVADSKFGLPVAGGLAERAVVALLACPALDLAGYHAHIGSQLVDVAAYVESIEVLVAFAAAMRDRHGVVPRQLSPGGGFGIAYIEDAPSADIRTWAQATGAAIAEACAVHRLTSPEVAVEPGRVVVGPAGVALYRVGATKALPGVRTYVAVDGGMADNIRPALYGARYSAAVANRRPTGMPALVTIAGRYCESGDLLIEDIALPPVEAGDLLAIPAAGAYCLAMASNYNLALRPAAVLVGNGQARLIRRRERYDDLLRLEVAADGTAER